VVSRRKGKGEHRQPVMGSFFGFPVTPHEMKQGGSRGAVELFDSILTGKWGGRKLQSKKKGVMDAVLCSV